jgi:hypothetical protein
MSEAKHTKGPWFAIQIPGTRFGHRALDPGSHIYDDGLWYVMPESDPERIPIAIIDHADDNYPPARAMAEHDARLIAAAPELADALEALVLWIEPPVEPEHEPTDDETTALLARARAALKAAGR